MTTQEPEAVLQHAADAAREHLFDTIHRLDHRAKSWVQGAAQTTRVSGLGLVGAFALWAGIALITRRRERRAGTALTLRARPPSVVTRVAITTARAAAAVLGYVLTRHWAMGLLAAHHAQQTHLSSTVPQVRQLSGAPALAVVQTNAETRGTPNA